MNVAMLGAIGSVTLAAAAMAPIARADDTTRPTATAAAEAACRKVIDPGESAELQTSRYDGCLMDALAFDPGLYFNETEDPDMPNQPGGMVDVRHYDWRGGSTWAFAIDLACPGRSEFAASCKGNEARVFIRVASLKPREAIPRQLRRPMEASLAAVRPFLDALVEWREADIRACPNAAAKLLSLEQMQWFAFEDHDRAIITGGNDLELIVPGEGPSAVLRARAFASTFEVQDFGDSGAVSDWAKDMLKTVEPCLKPSAAPAPWRRD